MIDELATALAEIERLKDALSERYDAIIAMQCQAIETVKRAYAAGRVEGLKEALKAIEEAGGDAEPITERITARIGDNRKEESVRNDAARRT